MGQQLTPEAVWTLLETHQGEEFFTSKGLPFTYSIKGGEIFISRRSKTITRSTFLAACRKVCETPQTVTGPKALGVFGAPYLWALFLALGVVQARPAGETRCVYGGYAFYVPLPQVSSEGVILDLYMEVPKETFQKFWDRYGSFAGREADMTRQQEEAAVRENPLQFSVRPELFCGARALRMQRSRSSCRMPQALAEELEAAHASEPELIPGLNPESAWKITRCLFAWPDGKPSAASRPSWTLRLSADTVTVPAGPVLSAAAGCRPFSLDVPHPVSGQRYRIQVLQVHGERMDLSPESLPDFLRGARIPSCITVLDCRITPRLPKGESLALCSLRDADTPEWPQRPGFQGAASIGVIGGADGPTSVFIAGRSAGEKKQDSEKTVSFTAGPWFLPERHAVWQPRFTIPACPPEEFALGRRRRQHKKKEEEHGTKG